MPADYGHRGSTSGELAFAVRSVHMSRPSYSGYAVLNIGSTRFNFGPAITAWKVFTRRGWVWVHELRVGDEVSRSISDDRSGYAIVESVVYDLAQDVLDS